MALAIFNQSAATLVGIGSPLLYRLVGVGLLGFAGLVAWTGTRQPVNTFHAVVISLADILWVLGTILLIGLAAGSLQPAGIAALVVVAGFVLLFAVLQMHGINAMYAVPDKPHTQRLCVAVDTPEPAGTMWPIIADLASIQAYSPNLTHVILRDGAQPGVDAVRQCTDVKGNTWGEYCKRYDEQARNVEFEFLAGEPGFPYPFKTMVGGWEVTPNGSGSTETIWFEVTPKYGPANPMIMAVMAKDLASGFGDVVARMAAAARGETAPAEVSLAQHGIRSRLVPCT
ncbi:MAG: SRPBCC family protein [Anaerolineae bacterium]